MKTILPLFLLVSGAGVMRDDIIQSISFDLSALHAGSRLAGIFTLSNSPMDGDTAPVLLSFSDPADYTPTTLTSTITIRSGTPSGFAVDFTPLTFTNPGGNVTPINTRDVSLTRFAFAVCTTFPCTASGGFQDRSPAVFSATYTIAPAAAAVPEPGYVLPLTAIFAAILVGRRIVRAPSPLCTPATAPDAQR